MASEIITEVANVYALDEAIMDRIKLQYTTFIGNTGNKKVIKSEHNEHIFHLTIRTNEDKNLSEIALAINAINLRVRYITGDEIEKYCSCDSTYMLSTMDRVGKAMENIFFG